MLRSFRDCARFLIRYEKNANSESTSEKQPPHSQSERPYTSAIDLLDGR